MDDEQERKVEKRKVVVAWQECSGIFIQVWLDAEPYVVRPERRFDTTVCTSWLTERI